MIVYCNIKQHGIVEHHEMVRFIDNKANFNFNLRLNMIVFWDICNHVYYPLYSSVLKQTSIKGIKNNSSHF